MVEALSVNVFVTGFGPFPDGRGGKFAQNASHLVTKLFPAQLHAETAINPSAAHINIINPTSAAGQFVKVEYAYVREYCKQLHQAHSKDIDLFVHIGMAAGWDFVTVERMAFKQGMNSSWWGPRERNAYYMIPDNVGKTVEDAGPSPWDDVPMGLQTALDVDAVVEGARKVLASRDTFLTRADRQNGSEKPIEVKAHNEGGSYTCGFIHYESLANCYVNKRTPNVLFCHVPGETDEQSLTKARDAVLAIIVSGVNQVLTNGTKMSQIAVPFPSAV